ncbi:MAG: hypothetical protein WC338_08020 [Candidatus Ratteibacteria bacterium]|jgi:hypothetical protein
MDTPDRQTIAESEARRTAEALAAAVRDSIQNISGASDKLYQSTKAIAHTDMKDALEEEFRTLGIKELENIVFVALPYAPKNSIIFCQRNRILWIEHA